jgi:hypothetical protein
MKLLIGKWYPSNLVAVFGIERDEKKMELLLIYGTWAEGLEKLVVFIKGSSGIRATLWLDKGEVGVSILLHYSYTILRL